MEVIFFIVVIFGLCCSAFVSQVVEDITDAPNAVGGSQHILDAPEDVDGGVAVVEGTLDIIKISSLYS